MKIINFICSGIVGIMVLTTAFMIWRLESIRKVSQAKTKQARIIALVGGIAWLLIFFIFNDGWHGGGFFDEIGFFVGLLLVMPYVGFLRLWFCRRLDKIGKTVTPHIANLKKWEADDGTAQWYVQYEYLGEYRGKRKVEPTMQILEAQYAQANDTTDEAEGAIAAVLPDARVRYLTQRPNIHRFEYAEPEMRAERRKMRIALHEKGFFQMNWKVLLITIVFSFLATVVLIGWKTWNDRNDLIVRADAGWVNTEVMLEKGQCIRLEPFGRVRISETEGYDGEIGVAGWQALCIPNEGGDCMKNNAPYGGLIARFGDGRTFVLDATRKVSVTDTGPLWLAVNDNLGRFEDNSGSFRVKYRVLNKPCD